MPYGVRNGHGEVLPLAQVFSSADSEQEARRLAALAPGCAAVQRVADSWLELPDVLQPHGE